MTAAVIVVAMTSTLSPTILPFTTAVSSLLRRRIQRPSSLSFALSAKQNLSRHGLRFRSSIVLSDSSSWDCCLNFYCYYDGCRHGGIKMKKFLKISSVSDYDEFRNSLSILRVHLQYWQATSGTIDQ
ncbi:hypothetical protein AKJ16_DCAP10205 [Drosera capensis]